MLTTIIALALVTQAPSSGVGEPPKNASPELVEMYHRLNAEVSVHAPPPASVVASPIHQQVPLDAEIHQRQVPTIQSPVVNDSTRALVAKKRADLARKGQSYQQDMRRIESENARAQAAAAAYRYYNTPDYVNVTRNSDGSFSTYATTPGGFTQFKDYTPVIRTPRYGIGVGPSYFDYDVYTSQSQSYSRP